MTRRTFFYTKESSEEYAISILKHINYYRLTAYFLPFRDEITQKYDNNKVSLEKIYAIYQFDSELRLLLMAYWEEIELYFRTQIAYNHAEQFGALAYKSAENFNKFHKYEDKIHLHHIGFTENWEHILLK